MQDRSTGDDVTQFLFVGNIFLSPFLKNSLLGLVFLTAFYFQSLKISSLSFLACTVSTEKSDLSYTASLNGPTHFSLAAFKILSSTFDSLLIMCLSVALLESNSLGPFGPHETGCPFLSPHLAFFNPYCLKVLSLALSSHPGIPIIHSLSTLFLVILSFCSSDRIISNDLCFSSLILTSACSSVLLKTSIVFLSIVIIFFSSSFLFALLRFLFLCWSPHFVHVLFS